MSRSSSIKDYVTLEGLGLSVGETKMFYCPTCNAKHEDKLAITKTEDGALIYYCHRASCIEKGATNYRLDAAERLAKPVDRFKPRKLKTPLVNPPTELYRFMHSKYGLDDEILKKNGMKYAPEQGRIYFPVMDRQGNILGDYTKAWEYNAKSLPKALMYWHKDVPQIHFPFPDAKHGRLVLVEDIISAIKVSQIMPAAALLGTHITEAMALMIARNYKNVTLALDPDAFGKSVSMGKEWRSLFNSNIVRLDADPKDTPLDKLREQLLWT